MRVTSQKPDWRKHVTIADMWGRHERGLDGFDPKAWIEGLEHALQNPTPARSEYIWNNLLAPHRHLVAGVVESSTRKDFAESRRKNLRSLIGDFAARERWLPDAGGVFHRPDELSLDDLPQSYERDEALAKALGMIQPVVEEAGRQLGLPPELLRAMSKRPDLVKRFMAEMQASATTVADGNETDSSDSGDDRLSADAFDFAAALSEVFDRSDPTARAQDANVPSPASGTVGNPELRRERVQEAIEEDKKAEPSSRERFSRVRRKVWEARDSAVKHFLLEQYGGRCQICDDVFERRDGAPYFEGLYLVSRTRGRWLDRPGNVLSLCATCCAKFLYGSVQARGIIEQVTNWRTAKEGGGRTTLSLTLCGEPVELRFTEKHLLELQEIVKSVPASVEGRDSAQP